MVRNGYLKNSYLRNQYKNERTTVVFCNGGFRIYLEKLVFAFFLKKEVFS